MGQHFATAAKRPGTLVTPLEAGAQAKSRYPLPSSCLSSSTDFPLPLPSMSCPPANPRGSCQCGSGWTWCDAGSTCNAGSRGPLYGTRTYIKGELRTKNPRPGGIPHPLAALPSEWRAKECKSARAPHADASPWVQEPLRFRGPAGTEGLRDSQAQKSDAARGWRGWAG